MTEVIMLEKLLSVVALDSDIAGSTIAGAATESLVHRRRRKELIGHFLRALSVGWLLATFIAPAIQERMSLSKAESVAISFIAGYAGIKILNTSEKAVLTHIKNKKSES